MGIMEAIVTILQFGTVVFAFLLVFDAIYDAIYARRQHRKNRKA